MVGFSVTNPFQFFHDLQGQPLNNGLVYIGTANLDPRTNPITVYWDEALTISAAQPISISAGFPMYQGSPANIYVGATDYSIRIEDAVGSLVYSAQSAPLVITDAQVSSDDGSSGSLWTTVKGFITYLRSSVGSSIVGYNRGVAGSQTIGADDKLNTVSVNAVVDFGADNTGATNATTALKAFYDHCILTGQAGHIPAGSYLVTAGVLAFDTGFTDKFWPSITTDGFDAVTFKRADATDAPILTLSNGTATSGVGNYWNGGCHGGVTFSQNGKAQASNQHGIKLVGVYGTKFGWMRANDQGGSCVYSPELLYGGVNPDPYAVSSCEFEGIEANRCLRYALENNNYVGFAGNTIKNLRVINCMLGGWYGFGAGNVCHIASMGSVRGWAFDDGTHTASTGGSPSRITIGIAELDDVQNGFRLNKVTMFRAEQIRIIARYNFSAINPSEGYWPRIGINLNGGTGPGLVDIYFNVAWRIEAGGVKADLGVFTNLNSISSTNVKINNRIFDNAGFGFVNSDLYANRNGNGSQVLRNRGSLILDDEIKHSALVRSATSVTVPNSGYGTAAAKIAFATPIADRGANYSTADSWYTVPYSGLYRVVGRICLTMAVGTRVRFGFATDTAGVIGIVLNQTAYQVNAGAQHYEISGVVSLAAGQRVFLMADQNTAGPVNLSAPISLNADLTWSIEPL